MIVIPMAGQGRRFREAGYERPKYELPLHGESLFACSLRSFERYFDSERFLFVTRAGCGAEAFVGAECERLGIHDRRVIALETPTRGPAETVLLGLRKSGCPGNDAILIFGVDAIRPGYAFPPEAAHSDGYLEVVHAAGEHWYFVRPAASFTRRVAETAERQRISALCCTGIYYFARAADFAAACEGALATLGDAPGGPREAALAPLYNGLIAAGRHIMYDEAPASRVHVAATPAAYGALVASHRSLP